MNNSHKTENGRFLDCLLEISAAAAGLRRAEVSRVEDTLGRLGKVYGAERTDTFVIPSMISMSLTFPAETLTETRRINSNGSTDFYRLEKLNALSRECCDQPLPLEELSGASAKLPPRRAERRRSSRQRLAAGSLRCFSAARSGTARLPAAFALSHLFSAGAVGAHRVQAGGVQGAEHRSWGSVLAC